MNTRTIKFRVWFKDRMLEDSGVLVMPSGTVWLATPHGEKNENTRLDKPNAVMQFTGLLDKNGKEIYEGDILLVPDEAIVPVTDEGQGPVEGCPHFVAVEFREGEFGFEVPDTDMGETGRFTLRGWRDDISDEPYEVIGNIYENPELIEKAV